MCSPGAVFTAAGPFLTLEPTRCMPQPIALIIDSDIQASNNLAELLMDHREEPEVMTATSIMIAERALQSERIDWLFIRISVWDDYQKLAPALAKSPDRVVFLSPARENCTENLAGLFDAHLKPPYSASKITRIWTRLTHPAFRARPLDFFFLRTGCQYAIIRYGDLRQVRRRGNKIQIFTRHGDYELIGSVVDFQARLPKPLTRVGRSWLVNEAY